VDWRLKEFTWSLFELLNIAYDPKVFVFYFNLYCMQLVKITFFLAFSNKFLDRIDINLHVTRAHYLLKLFNRTH